MKYSDLTPSEIENQSLSKPSALPGEYGNQDMKAAKIRALRGKYRNSLTPSDEYAKLKYEEIIEGRD